MYYFDGINAAFLLGTTIGIVLVWSVANGGPAICEFRRCENFARVDRGTIAILFCVVGCRLGSHGQRWARLCDESST